MMIILKGLWAVRWSIIAVALALMAAGGIKAGAELESAPTNENGSVDQVHIDQAPPMTCTDDGSDCWWSNNPPAVDGQVPPDMVCLSVNDCQWVRPVWPDSPSGGE